ncbi:MAG: guanylate kinase [Clostridiales bacterium]|jgi:guanylate kinase|nr:guanylate kinase [Clostridiales bacterium]
MLGKGLLVVISGPSGAGKGTLCKVLLERNKELKLSVSCTTRSPRAAEREGINYFFITKDKFDEMKEKDEFLEYAEVYGNYYGTPMSYVNKVLEEGKDVILEIDIQGALKVKNKYPDGVFIFIMPPTMDELKNRIKKRGSETEESLLRRFRSAFEELNYLSSYNYVVINDEIDPAVNKLENIISAERCRVDRVKSIVLEKINYQEGQYNE